MLWRMLYPLAMHHGLRDRITASWQVARTREHFSMRRYKQRQKRLEEFNAHQFFDFDKQDMEHEDEVVNKKERS